MAKRYSGLIEVARSADGSTSWVVIPGKISADSSIDPDNTTTNSTTGIVYGGSSIVAAILFLDFEGYADTLALMPGDGDWFWRFTYDDGQVIITSRAVNAMVKRQGGVNARDGVVAWELRLERYASEVIY